MAFPFRALFIANVFVGLCIAGNISVGVWAALGDISRAQRARYPWQVILSSRLPFATAWRTRILPEDRPAFARSRRRHLVLLTSGALYLLALTARVAVLLVYMHHPLGE